MPSKRPSSSTRRSKSSSPTLSLSQTLSVRSAPPLRWSKALSLARRISRSQLTRRRPLWNQRCALQIVPTFMINLPSASSMRVKIRKILDMALLQELAKIKATVYFLTNTCPNPASMLPNLASTTSRSSSRGLRCLDLAHMHALTHRKICNVRVHFAAEMPSSGTPLTEMITGVTYVMRGRSHQ